MLASKYLVDWLLSALGDDSLSGAGPLDGAKLLLFTNDQPPNVSWTIADIVEADFAGYPAGGEEVTAWTVPVNEGTNARKVVGTACTFISTDTASVTAVTGYALTDAGGTTLLACRKLAAPWNPTSGANLTIVPAVVLPRVLADEDLVSND